MLTVKITLELERQEHSRLQQLSQQFKKLQFKLHQHNKQAPPPQGSTITVMKMEKKGDKMELEEKPSTRKRGNFAFLHSPTSPTPTSTDPSSPSSPKLTSFPLSPNNSNSSLPPAQPLSLGASFSTFPVSEKPKKRGKPSEKKKKLSTSGNNKGKDDATSDGSLPSSPQTQPPNSPAPRTTSPTPQSYGNQFSYPQNHNTRYADSDGDDSRMGSGSGSVGSPIQVEGAITSLMGEVQQLSKVTS